MVQLFKVQGFNMFKGLIGSIGSIGSISLSVQLVDGLNKFKGSIKSKLASKSEPELGTAQPQLVCIYLIFNILI